MRRIGITLLLVFVLLLSSAPVLAAPGKDNPKPINPRVLEAVFIHYENPAKPAKPGSTLPPPVNDYFELIGPAWDLAKYPAGVPFVINPSGAPAGAEFEVVKAFEAWDAATGQELFNNAPVISYSSWWGQQDGKNNVSWQVLGSGSIIAGTWIWFLDNDGGGTMSPGDEVTETDIVFNASMRWGIDANGEGAASSLKNQYDVCNIATHEIGHVVGLDDLYDVAYRDITMYGYGAKTETKKISLQTGDILGTAALYP